MEITLHVSLDPEQRSSFEETTRRLAGIAKIAVLDQITSGRSQATVFVVDVTPEANGGPAGLHVLKLDTRWGIRKELQGYGRARETAMSKHMPVVVAQTPTEKPFKTAAILYSLAQDTFRDAISLRDLVDQSVFRARDQLDALAQVLQELFDSHAVESAHPYDLVRTELGSLLKGGRSIIRVGENHLHLHADRELVRYEGDIQVWPNPIAYIQRKTLWEEARALVWPALCAHGDLHTENVICPKSGLRSQVPELIDFTHFREKTSLFYDLVYLELALLLRVLAPNTDLRRQGWLQLGEVFDQQVLVDAERVGGPGVLSACTLLDPLRRLAADFIESSDRPEDFESAFWLTGAVVGLNYFRKLADDPFERKLAFLIAARRLATLLNRLNVDFYRHQASYELSWLSDETTVRQERSVRVPLGIVDVPSRRKRPPSYDIDLHLGLDILGERILDETGSMTSPDYEFFSNHKNALLMNRHEAENNPVRDLILESEKNRITVQLDGLARRYLGQNFVDLCLEDLSGHIAQDLALLKDYEDTLRYEDDPRRRARCRREIEQLRESASRYQQEYDELREQVSGEPPTEMQGVAVQLQQMDVKLDTLLAGQTAVRDDLNYLRQTLLARYDVGEQNAIATITEQLAQSQMTTLLTILDVLEASRLSDAEILQALNAVQETLTALQQRGVSLLGQQAVVDAIDAPTLDVKHKLKVSLPIIPLLLGYEGELELGSGVNLEAVWERLVAKVRRG